MPKNGSSIVYVCPMHPEVRQNTPGVCPKCGGMKLVPEHEIRNGAHPDHVPASTGFWTTYKPLLIIVGLILLTTVAVAFYYARLGIFDWQESMMDFMAGFFLVFAGFKLLDLRGFAAGYARYDLLARHVKAYGYLYPFLELGLGLAYITRIDPYATNIATLVLMTFSGIGVTLSLLQKRRFECACLGTFIKVPLTKVTIVEDFGMAAMAALMLAGDFIR